MVAEQPKRASSASSSSQATHWPPTSTVLDCDTMVLLQRLGLLTGARALPSGKMTGLVCHTTRGAACYIAPVKWRFVHGSALRKTTQTTHHGNRTHAASDRDSSTDDNAQSDGGGTVASEKVTALLRLSDEVTVLQRAQDLEMKVHKGWKHDCKVILPPLLYTTAVIEGMRAVNHFFHIWGDATPAYFGIMQAAAMLVWVYLALRSSGRLHINMATPQTDIKTAQSEPDDRSTPELYEAVLNVMKRSIAGLDRAENTMRPLRTARASSGALAAAFATELFRVLLQEYPSSAPFFSSRGVASPCSSH